MTEYVYKSITGKPVNIDNYIITPEPGMYSKYQIDSLDVYLGSLLSRYDDGVLTLVDTTDPVKGTGGGGSSVSSSPATNIILDTQGRPLTYTVAGITKTVVYGQYGISSITGSDGNIDTYSYSTVGNLTGIVNSSGSTGVPSSVTYDTDYTILGFTVNSIAYTIAYLTNTKGKQVSTVTGGGHTTTYSYDVLGNFTGSTTV